MCQRWLEIWVSFQRSCLLGRAQRWQENRRRSQIWRFCTMIDECTHKSSMSERNALWVRFRRKFYFNTDFQLWVYVSELQYHKNMKKWQIQIEIKHLLHLYNNYILIVLHRAPQLGLIMRMHWACRPPDQLQYILDQSASGFTIYFSVSVWFWITLNYL